MGASVIRRDFPEWVLDPYAPTCRPYPYTTVRFQAGPPGYTPGRHVNLKFHFAAAEAMEALSTVFQAHNYLFRETAGGSFNCRKITGGTRTSPHAHGASLDINPSKNRYRGNWLGGRIQWGRNTDMTPQMIADVEAIRCKNGKRALYWGGRWYNVYDPMHFDVGRRHDLVTGIDWTTVRGGAMWKKPGDPVVTDADADAVFAYYGSVPSTKLEVAAITNRAMELDVAARESYELAQNVVQRLGKAIT